MSERDLAALERRIARLIETAEDEARRVRTLTPGSISHRLAHAELRRALDALRDARAEVMALPVGNVAKSNRVLLIGRRSRSDARRSGAISNNVGGVTDEGRGEERGEERGNLSGAA